MFLLRGRGNTMGLLSFVGFGLLVPLIVNSMRAYGPKEDPPCGRPVEILDKGEPVRELFA